MQWFHLKTMSVRAGVVEAEVSMRADSFWFEGHFPGDPIFPGVAQLALVQELMARGAGAAVTVLAVKRVRFRQIVRPGDCLKVTIKPNHGTPTGFIFTITGKDQVVCSGLMIIDKPVNLSGV